MTSVVTFPGVLSVERQRGSLLGYARVHPASGWVNEQKLLDWRNQVHVVTKATLSKELSEKLGILLPEEQISPKHRHALRALRSTPLVQISNELASDLTHHGVRVWTVGYHRNPGLLRIVADGGNEPPICIEQVVYDFFSPETRWERPLGRPSKISLNGPHLDDDRIDWILRAVSSEVLDEPSILLARAVARSFPLLLESGAKRRSTYDEVIGIRNDPQAEECFYADLQYDELQVPAWETWVKTSGTLPSEATVVVAQAMAASNGPTQVEVLDAGVFWREELPALPLRLKPTSGDGWFDSLVRPIHSGPYRGGAIRVMSLDLHIPTLHRYVSEFR